MTRNHAATRARRRPMTPSDASSGGNQAARRTVAPNRWMGECDCLIGPFTCQRVAESFANAMVEFGHYECVCQRVVVHAGTYFVEACGVGEGSLSRR